MTRRQVERMVDIAMWDLSKRLWFVDGTRSAAIEAGVIAESQGGAHLVNALVAVFEARSISAIYDDPHDEWRTDLLQSAAATPPGRNDFAQEAQK